MLKAPFSVKIAIIDNTVKTKKTILKAVINAVIVLAYLA